MELIVKIQETAAVVLMLVLVFALFSKDSVDKQPDWFVLPVAVGGMLSFAVFFCSTLMRIWL
jgi:hypothetical protein